MPLVGAFNTFCDKLLVSFLIRFSTHILVIILGYVEFALVGFKALYEFRPLHQWCVRPKEKVLVQLRRFSREQNLRGRREVSPGTKRIYLLLHEQVSFYMYLSWSCDIPRSQSNTLTWSCDIPQPIRLTQLIMWHTLPSQTLLIMWHILANQTDCSIICMKYVFGWILGSFTLPGPISLGLFVLAISFRKKLTAFISKWYTFLQ